MGARINFAEVTDFFRYTMDKADKDEEKLDERLQPIPPELHGAVTRTSSDLLRHYDNLGNNLNDWNPLDWRHINDEFKFSRASPEISCKYLHTHIYICLRGGQPWMRSAKVVSASYSWLEDRERVWASIIQRACMTSDCRRTRRSTSCRPNVSSVCSSWPS